jgi:hypothetical protein
MQGIILMRLKLPIEYTVTAALRANSLGKKYAVIDTVDVEIVEVHEEDYPVAISWQQKSLPWDEPVGPRHTRFIAGDHWRPISEKDTGAPVFADNALSNLAAINNLLPKNLRRSGRVFEALADNKQTVSMYGESLSIIDAARLNTVELDDLDRRIQFQAIFQAHQHANNLLLCEGVLYHRIAEPVLVVNHTQERRPPNTLTLAVDDASKSFGHERHGSRLPLYTHRIDRLDDFRSVFEERGPAGDYEVYDLIEDLQVHRPDVFKFDDDNEALACVLEELRSGMSSIPSGYDVREVVEMHKRLGHNMSDNEKIALLAEVIEHPRLLQGASYAELRSHIDLVQDRWRFRPISNFSM